MKESTDRQLVIKALRPLDACSVENAVYPGYPDVEFIGGTMELKTIRSLPKGRFDNVKVPHFTPQQRAWAVRRRARGGNHYFLLHGPRLWALLDAEWAANHIGEVSVETIKACALWASETWDAQSFLEVVERGLE